MSVNLKDLVGLVMDSYGTEPDIIKIEPINYKQIIEIIGKLRELFFAGFFGSKNLKADSLEYYVGELLEEISCALENQTDKADKLHFPFLTPL